MAVEGVEWMSGSLSVALHLVTAQYYICYFVVLIFSL